MPNLKRTSPGFSLLELLVVISIMGIIIAMLAVSFGTAQVKARDSKRRSDIKALQNAFEQYFAINTSYGAASCAPMKDPSILPAGEPLDPLTGQAYTCFSSAASYCVCASLEEKDQSKGNATDDATSSTCDYGAGDFYCLSNLQ
jgi:prepilin-type N-terminal cleavage/methylation domain-containing protein